MMMKNRKLITSTLAALCLSASLTTPVFAAEPEILTETSTTETVSIQEEGAKNGLTNGLKNGLSNGMKNGLANGATNGMMNGLTNGAANGMMNGLTNGAVNGMMNGLPEGLKNGELKMLMVAEETPNAD